MHVVYEARDKEKPELLQFVADLAAVATQAELVQSEDELGCSLQAQLQRIFSFTLDTIGDDDIIVTSDVDIFPIDRGVLQGK